MVFVLAESGPLTLAWLVAAMGYGWWMRRVWLDGAAEATSIQVGTGIALLLFLDSLLGTLGVLQWGGSLGGWMVLMPGWAGVLMQLRRPGSAKLPAPFAWMTVAAAPSLAVLVVASCSAPGWLWASEFGGYDALSYHLQLPKEWLTLGRITPLDHNVYSFMPGSMEAAYYHLAVLRGDAIAAAYSCQLLHASMALLCAAVIARHAITRLNGAAGVIAGATLLSTPWVIVTGSLAYNEMAVCLMLATGLVVAVNTSLAPGIRGVLVGMVAATACAAKLSSVGMVAAPLGVALLWNLPLKRWFPACVGGAVVGLLILSPWLLRNWMTCGNPVFPFATDLLGLGHWSAEQTAIWSHGHHSSLGFSRRLGELWNQFFRYGWVSNPYAKEPWEPLWSMVQWCSIGGAALLFCVKQHRRWCAMLIVVLLLQFGFWLGFTHLKSRFLLPVIVPLSFFITGLAILRFGMSLRNSTALTDGQRRSIVIFICAVVMLLFSIINLGIFYEERNGAPAFAVGQLRAFTGDDLTSEQQREIGSTSLPAVALNHLLPRDSKILLIGDAKPFHYRGNVVYQTTWDRGPLSGLMREFPDQPARWSAELKQSGFTHVLIDETMLRIWRDGGWNDPLLTRDRVLHVASSTMVEQFKYANGVSIWKIDPGSRQGK